MTNRKLSITALITLASIGTQCLAADPFAGAKWNQTGPATVTEENGVCRLKIDDPFHDAGITITPPDGQTFDVSGYRILAVDVENLAPNTQARIVFDFFSAGEKKKREATLTAALNPGEKRTLRFKLPHEWKYAAPAGLPGMRTLDTSKLDPIRVIMQWPFEAKQAELLDVRISNLRCEEPLEKTPPTTAEQYLPFIDEYGQYIHADWPTKIHSDDDLGAAKKTEDAELAKAGRPANWDRFGGWKDGPQLKATGSFRTEKYQGKWYLIDPDGRLFISTGIDVLSPGSDPLKILPGKENFFGKLPQGTTTTYQATDHCLAIKYGTTDYNDAYFPDLQKRLEAWGMNSIGDWSRPALMALEKTPYTIELSDYNNKAPKLASTKRKFYDVFDPAYAERMKTLVAHASERNPMVQKSLNDPMCIGYFIDNELDFGNRNRLTLPDDVLKCPAEQPSKQEWVRDLKTKYASIDSLNSAWAMQYKDWDAVLASTDVPTGDAYKADGQTFFAKTLDQYFHLARDTVKSAAPNKLYLGCRFISTDAVRPALFNACAKYADVLSVNIYSATPGNFPSHETPDLGFPDIPVLIGEFHFGVTDRGAFTTGLCCPGVNQADRALAYTRFMEGMLTHPNFIGAHWFQYRDQPLTGRGDGEAYPIGFVDYTDTPYTEMGKASRAIAERMYQLRTSGNLKAAQTAQQ